MKLALTELSLEAFSPYGKLVERPPGLSAADGPGWKWWGEIDLLPASSRPYGVGYLELVPAALCFDWAERHMHSVEMIIPLSGDCLVYAGPAHFPEQPGNKPALEDFRVFRIPLGKAIILDEGVWHGAPLAIDRALNAIVLLQAGSGQNDCSLVRFPDTPVDILLNV